MTATFAFLGWSFYTLSGGADYQPREGSRQAEALRLKAEAAAQPTVVATVAQDKIDTVILDTVSMNSSDFDPGGLGDLPEDMTLRPIAVSADGQANDVIRWTATLNLAQPADTAPLEQIIATSTPAQQEVTRDIRRITGNVVNFRSGPGTRYGVVAKLSRGTEVEVLETFDNGWMRMRAIESNRVGWVLGTLVSKGNG
ncbi:SH3 domain-containing protein [Seohaeicola saemankumensis]|uniref:SH3 domain-containing protein n=1 Tax=Seohaeicola TaxID=481178 RepID=UPI0035D0CFF1